jgi:hypothetical protein
MPPRYECNIALLEWMHVRILANITRSGNPKPIEKNCSTKGGYIKIKTGQYTERSNAVTAEATESVNWTVAGRNSNGMSGRNRSG